GGGNAALRYDVRGRGSADTQQEPSTLRSQHPHMARIWKKDVGIDFLTRIHANTTVAHLGIEFVEIGDDFIRGRAPVDSRTKQPVGILHGGVSVLLAETLGSNGAALAIPPDHHAVGLEINANHIRSVSEGWVNGIA